MAEWLKALVLKTSRRATVSGFESLPLRQKKMKKEIEEIVEELCSPNGEFPTKIVELNGYDYLAFDWGPKTLF